MADALTTLTGLGSLNGIDSYQVIADSLGISLWVLITLTIIIGIWVLVWKGLALWKAAGKKSIPWFIILLIFNTFGILEILYIFVFSKISFKKKDKKEEKKKDKKKK
jgi:predicted membrane protein